MKRQTLRLFNSIIFLVLGVTIYAQDQDWTITRTVNSAGDNLSIPGLNILVKGTNDGTVTNQPNPVPDFSAIGFKTKKIPVGDDRVLNIVLQEDIQTLEETAGIGYGAVKRRDLTGSVVSISKENIMKTPTHKALDDIDIAFILDEGARELAGEFLFAERIEKYNPGITEFRAHHVLRPIPQGEIDQVINDDFIQNPGF